MLENAWDRTVFAPRVRYTVSKYLRLNLLRCKLFFEICDGNRFSPL